MGEAGTCPSEAGTRVLPHATGVGALRSQRTPLHLPLCARWAPAVPPSQGETGRTAFSSALPIRGVGTKTETPAAAFTISRVPVTPK